MRVKGIIVSRLFPILLLVGCKFGPKGDIYQESRLSMGTLVEIKLVAVDAQSAKTALTAAFAEIERIDKLMSFQSADNQLSRINQAAGRKRVGIDIELFRFILRAKSYSKLTKGAFDISIGPLVKLWGFDTEQYRLPGEDEIKTHLPLVDYRHVIVLGMPPALFLNQAGMSIDMGGIAKGYAVDRVISILERYGIASAMVNAGGDIRAYGSKPDGDLWKIGIQHPRDKKRILTSLQIDRQAVVTSGDYERFFIEQEVRYHHILDPATGQPARGCQSVTLVAKEAIAADALATGVFVLGPEEGMKLVESMKDTEAMIVDAEGNISVSSGLKDKLEFNH